MINIVCQNRFSVIILLHTRGRSCQLSIAIVTPPMTLSTPEKFFSGGYGRGSTDDQIESGESGGYGGTSSC